MIIQPPKPDPVIVRDQLQALQAQLKAWGAEIFCMVLFWILAKSEIADGGGAETGRLIPFKWNRIQHHLYSRIAQNNRLLKGRQAGFTTWFLIVRLLLPIITERGKTGLLISQNREYAEKHFAIAQRAVKYFGVIDPYNDELNSISHAYRANILHTKYSNRRELVFDMLDSQIIVASAEVEESGQGVTIHHGVGSEVSRWPGKPEETVSNIKGGIVPGGTWDEECTANGWGGYWHEQCLRSMNDEVSADARFHYYSWFWSDEYQTKLTPAQAAELMADLKADELALIKRFHRELAA